jgi:tetratricopeptide (TPR) repeat protein
MQLRTIEDVTDTLNEAKRNGRGCSVLLGAGCSVTGGIPTAREFVSIVAQRYGGAYRRAKEKTYPHCMAELQTGQRHELIAESVDKAMINWAHLALAQLIVSGFVDRVLTTNFDPLILRACAAAQVFPAVYDFAASQTFKPAAVPRNAVFHLHGQRSGFVLLNTDDEVNRLNRHLIPLFADAGRGRSWIVVGYSGDQDPVFEQLASVPSFEFPLFWVAFRDEPPSYQVETRLLTEVKGAFLVKGFDADTFFIQLAQNLACFPPLFIERPFTYLRKQLETFAPFVMQPGDASIDVTQATRLRLDHAIAQFEGPEHSYTSDRDLLARAEAYLVAGEYTNVIGLATSPVAAEAIAEPLYWAHIRVARQALPTSIKSHKFESVYLHYAAAAHRLPDRHEAIIAWGTALLEEARIKRGDEADKLWTAAEEKFREAARIKPDDHEGLNNWGTLLFDRALTKSGTDAQAMLEQAAEKYRGAIAVRPDLHEAMNSLGRVLVRQASYAPAHEADGLFNDAIGQFQAALQVRPNKHQALYSWGTALLKQASMKSGADAYRLYELAATKFEASLQIRPDQSIALNNWGTALFQLSKLAPVETRDSLMTLAAEKYRAAIRLEPSKTETLRSLANVLKHLAATRPETDARLLLSEAETKLRLVEETMPGRAAYDLACLAILRGNEDTARDWLITAKVSGTLPPKEHILADPDLDSVRDKTWFRNLFPDLSTS